MSIVCLVATWPAFSQDNFATVRLDGRGVFQVGPSNEGEDAAVRARRVEERLATLLRNLDAIGEPIARETGGNWSVVVSGVPVVSVTQRDAEDNLASASTLAQQWAAALDQALDRAVDRRRTWSGRLVAETRASVEAAFGRLLESAVRIVPRAFGALLVIGVFWLFARAVRGVLRALFRRIVDDVTVESLVKQLVYYFVLAVGFFVAADALGFDPTTVAAGLGLTGIVLGFALKDVLSNFVSGLLLLALRPFEIGDQIVVGDLEGNVERIELRATRIRAYDGRVALVPNAEVFTSRLVNNTADPVRRGKLGVFLGYDADVGRTLSIVLAAVGTADGVLPQPAPAVRVADLGPDDIELEATFWTDSRRSDFQNTASSVRAAIVAALKEADVALPDPDVRVLVPGRRSPG